MSCNFFFRRLLILVTLFTIRIMLTNAGYADTITFDDVNNKRYTIEYNDLSDSDTSFYFFEIVGMKTGERDSQEPLYPIYSDFDAGFGITDVICSYSIPDSVGHGYATMVPSANDAMGYDLFVDPETELIASFFTAANDLSYYSELNGSVVLKYISCE